MYLLIDRVLVAVPFIHNKSDVRYDSLFFLFLHFELKSIGQALAFGFNVPSRHNVSALFHPVQRERLRMARNTEQARKSRSASADGGECMVEDDVNEEVDEYEDLLADVTDAISRFKPVLLAALARNANAFDSVSSGKVDDDALLLAGEIAILAEIGSIVPGSDLIMDTAVMACLMKNKVVSGMAVSRWALAHTTDAEDENGVPVSGDWWKYASLAILHAIEQSCSRLEMEKTDLGGGIGMIIDDSHAENENPAETAALRLEEALKSTVPILRYVTERACGILVGYHEEKKIPLGAADLVEGLKCFIRAILFHFYSAVLLKSTTPGDGGDTILTAANVQKGFGSMDADGKMLAATCQNAKSLCKGDQGRRLLQSLSTSLEKLI